MSAPTGSAHPAAKIDEAQALEIKRLLKQKELTQGQIAARFGVDRTTVCNIKNGKTWQHVKLPKRDPASAAPVVCAHNGRHEHGTLSMYMTDRCRCGECRDEHSAYAARRNQMIREGTWQNHLHPPEPLQKHLRMLERHGIGAVQLSRLAGLSSQTYKRVMAGKRVQRRTALRILRVEPDIRHASPGSWIDVTGTRRRVQALIAMGWSQTVLLAELGLSEGCLSRIHFQKTVRVRTARAVIAGYDRLWNQPAPEDRRKSFALGMARRKGFLPPLAWDDDEIDDPEATPHGEWRATA